MKFATAAGALTAGLLMDVDLKMPVEPSLTLIGGDWLILHHTATLDSFPREDTATQMQEDSRSSGTVGCRAAHSTPAQGVEVRRRAESANQSRVAALHSWHP